MQMMGKGMVVVASEGVTLGQGTVPCTPLTPSLIPQGESQVSNGSVLRLQQWHCPGRQPAERVRAGAGAVHGHCHMPGPAPPLTPSLSSAGSYSPTRWSWLSW